MVLPLRLLHSETSVSILLESGLNLKVVFNSEVAANLGSNVAVVYFSLKNLGSKEFGLPLKIQYDATWHVTHKCMLYML